MTIDHSPRNPLKLSYVDAASAMRSPSSCSLLDPLLPYLLRDTSLTKPHYGDDQETTTLPRFPAFTKRAGFSHARGHVLNFERLYASQGGNATSRMKGGVAITGTRGACVLLSVSCLVREPDADCSPVITQRLWDPKQSLRISISSYRGSISEATSPRVCTGWDAWRLPHMWVQKPR